MSTTETSERDCAEWATWLENAPIVEKYGVVFLQKKDSAEIVKCLCYRASKPVTSNATDTSERLIRRLDLLLLHRADEVLLVRVSLLDELRAALASQPVGAELRPKFEKPLLDQRGSGGAEQPPSTIHGYDASQPVTQSVEPLDLISYNKGWDAAMDSMRQVAAHVAEAAQSVEPVGYAIYGYGRIQRLIISEDAAYEYADQMERNAREAGYRDCNATVKPLHPAAPQVPSVSKGADEAFEDHYKRDSRDPTCEQELSIWRAGWAARGSKEAGGGWARMQRAIGGSAKCGA